MLVEMSSKLENCHKNGVFQNLLEKYVIGNRYCFLFFDEVCIFNI